MKRRFTAIVLTACLAMAVSLAACGQQPSVSPPGQDFTSVPQADNSQTATGGQAPYRAVWFSFLDWNHLDTSGETAFTQSAETVMKNCASVGANTVIIQVRPFGDAIYPSEIYGWSYLCTGTAGQNPGYDPLEILIQQAHAQGLAVEAWINPYRIRSDASRPAGELAQDNPAVQHPEWTKAAAGGLYYNPALPEVRKLVVDGVVEILQNYEVQGIHFDDYFYPTTDESFDAEEYAASGSALALGDWRRENVNTLIREVYAAVKQTKPSAVFGISPQGNNDNNYNGQYSDVGLWLQTEGYADYIMPQLYWGFGFTLQSGADTFAFENAAARWAQMPRSDKVKLCFGLGAFRVGAGDGGSNDQSEWQTGENLAAQAQALRDTAGVSGYALFRYGSLFGGGEYADLCAQECKALAELENV